MTPPIRAVIFDFDGLIVDTESTGYLTWNEIFAEHGHELPVERYAQVIGSDFNSGYDPRRDLEALVGGVRFGERTVAIDRQPGVEGSIARFGRVEVGLGELAR